MTGASPHARNPRAGRESDKARMRFRTTRPDTLEPKGFPCPGIRISLIVPILTTGEEPV